MSDNKNDNSYARTCLNIIEDSTNLSPEKIGYKLMLIGNDHYPNFSEPKIVMLRELHNDIYQDVTYAEGSLANDETIRKHRQVLEDYLSGNYYPTCFELEGAYIKSDHSQGNTWKACIKHNKFQIECDNLEVLDILQSISEMADISDHNEEDLMNFKSKLPANIGDLILANSHAEELLF